MALNLSASQRRRVAMLLLLLVALLLPAGVSAQRRVNPVKSASKEIQGKNENRLPTDSINLAAVARRTDANGNTIYVDTITGLQVPDSIANLPGNLLGRQVPKMIQPLWHSVTVGVSIWDPVMRLLGQPYGVAEVSGALNLHNRYIPVAEFGLGQTNYTPSGNNYTYRVPLTPYFRVGVDYNFLYNSNPDYLVMAGARLGWSRFSYQLRDVSVSSDYWGEHSTFNFPSQTASATYLQLCFGLKVKIVGPLSMGWTARFQSLLHQSRAPMGEPWYIPGFGTKAAPLTGSFSIYYTLPLHKPVPLNPAPAEGQ